MNSMYIPSPRLLLHQIMGLVICHYINMHPVFLSFASLALSFHFYNCYKKLGQLLNSALKKDAFSSSFYGWMGEDGAKKRREVMWRG